MPSAFTVKIKVPPYIRKYLIAKSENYEEPLVFCNKHAFTMLLSHEVSNYQTLSCISPEEEENIHNYFSSRWSTFEFVEIKLPFHIRKDPRSYNYLSVKGRANFLAEVKSHFYLELTSYLIKRLRKNVQRKIALEEFLALHSINEEDVKYETMYRQTTRILEPYL